MEFKLVDIVAHDFKHIHASDRNAPPNRITLSFALYGRVGFNTHTFNDTGQMESLRHLTFIVRDALKFVQEQAEHSLLLNGVDVSFKRRLTNERAPEQEGK